MSELIVIVFKDQYRASEVLNDLQRREWDWTVDLDHAVVVRHTEQDKFKVLFSLDPTTKEEEVWARLWGSLLSLALFTPLTEGITGAVKNLAVATGSQTKAEIDARKVLPDVKWWRESLGLSSTFVRDVGAMIQPGDSALFSLLQMDKPGIVFQQLRNYGGTLVHTKLSSEQGQTLKDVLALN